MAAGLTFRRAGPDDGEVIRQITRAAYAKWVPLIGREPLPMTFDFTDLVGKHRFELCMADGETAGLVQMIPMDGWMRLENIAVVPDRQSRGIGTALLKHGEAVARLGNCSQMCLYTNLAFTQNIDFYKRRGYRITAHKPFRGGVMVDMAKRLT